MEYKNKLGKNLNIVKFKRTKRLYELRYDVKDKYDDIGLLNQLKKFVLKPFKSLVFFITKKPKNSLNTMSTDKIEDYVENNYIKADSFKKEDLLADLIVFKTYKENLEVAFRLDEFVLNCIAIGTAIIAITMTISSSFPGASLKIVKIGSKILGEITTKKVVSNTVWSGSKILSIVYWVIVYYLFKWKVSSTPTSKIKTLNNSIYILEALKEDMYNAGEKVPDTRNFEVNVDNLIGEKPEPRKYFVSVTEIKEDKSNEDTIEDKNKAIE